MPQANATPVTEAIVSQVGRGFDGVARSGRSSSGTDGDAEILGLRLYDGRLKPL
jgi:hypothetical protein